MLAEKNYVVDHPGVCPICDENVRFQSLNDWLRDHLFCSECLSIPRERALMHVIRSYYPDYKTLDVHESSPGGRGASIKLHEECESYTASQFYPDIEEGKYHKIGYQCQNLERMTFEDNSFDLFITQDVMEHIFDPAKAFKEIARVLKPGGAHIFTVPIVNKEKPSVRCASMHNNGEIFHFEEPEYHGNPVDSKGALVVMNWGYDIADFIYAHARTATTIVAIDNLEMGIRAELNEVLISRKKL
jgi:SAM-dependent methyltransferase